MKKLVAAVVLLTFAGAAFAQPPGGMGGGPSPEMMAMFKKMGEWRDKNKNLFNVGRTMGALAEFEKEPKTALTKDQAKKILAVVNPWKTKPVMTDANAKDMLKQVGATFTVAQATKMAQISKEAAARGWGGGGGGGGMRPGGGGPPGGGGGGMRPGGGGGMMDPAAMKKRMDAMMKGFNPLNFATIPDSPMKERSTKPVKDGLEALEKKSK